MSAAAAATPADIAPPSKSWWQRNWKWALAMGAGSVVLVFACIAGLSVRALLRNSDGHVDTVARARSNAQVVAKLGEPIQPGFMPIGDISISTGGGGSADLRIPLRGPRGEGRLIAVADRAGGRWQYESLTFEGADAGAVLKLAEPGTPIGDAASTAAVTSGHCRYARERLRSAFVLCRW